MDVVNVFDELSISFFNSIRNKDDEEYLISIIKYHGAPTIAGVKPSSLINFNSSGRCLYRLWEKYRDGIEGKTKVKYYEIKNWDDRALVLFYKPEYLERVLLQLENMKYLRKFGYKKDMGLDGFLGFLKYRFTMTFPHEIGIFLGIPADDVEGFIKNSGRGFLINGYWKVYNSPERAGEMFRKYDNARIDVIKAIMEKSL